MIQTFWMQGSTSTHIQANIIPTNSNDSYFRDAELGCEYVNWPKMEIDDDGDAETTSHTLRIHHLHQIPQSQSQIQPTLWSSARNSARDDLVS